MTNQSGPGTVCWTNTLLALDDEIPGRQIHQVVRFRGNIDKTTKTAEVLDTLTGSYGPVDPSQVLLEGDEGYSKGLLLVGWFVRDLVKEKASGHGGCIADSRQVPIKASTIDKSRIFRAGYQMGKSAKGASPMALTNPDHSGVCTVFQIPQGAIRVLYYPEYLDFKEANEKNRLRGQGARISKITRPKSTTTGAQTQQEDMSDNGTLGQPAGQSSLTILDYKDWDFCLRSRIAQLEARLASDVSDIAATEELIKCLEELDVAHPETEANVALTKMIYTEDVFVESDAEAALQEAKVCLLDAKYIGLEADNVQKLWPAMFEMDAHGVLDKDFFLQLSMALKKKRPTLVVRYEKLELLIGLLRLADPMGDKKKSSMRQHWVQETEQRAKEDAWADHVEIMYRNAQSLGVPHPRHETPMTESTALRAAITGIKSAVSLGQRAKLVIGGQAARTFGHMTGNPIALDDAIRRLPDTHNYSTQRLLTASIYKGVAKKFADTFCQPLLEHLGQLERFLVHLQVVDEEEENGDGEQSSSSGDTGEDDEGDKMDTEDDQ
ncbi:hypothetical protein K4K55_011033 [Colletotrichum sp. SAR 10_96]|nr:hypothetical protein K4K55_011033 [Colletotrichum sp. SAR 10_96]